MRKILLYYPNSYFSRLLKALENSWIEYYVWSSSRVENGVTIRTYFSVLEFDNRGNLISYLFNKKGNWII